MNYYGQIDLGSYFGTEIRLIDGEEYICIPKRFNPTIRFFSGHASMLLDLIETRHPDKDGFTHLLAPHIPRAMVQTLPEADFIKMSSPIGRFKVIGQKPVVQEQEQPRAIGYEILAENPVTDDNIPL